MLKNRRKNHRVTGTTAIKHEKGLRVPVIIVNLLDIFCLSCIQSMVTPVGVAYLSTFDGEYDSRYDIRFDDKPVDYLDLV